MLIKVLEAALATAVAALLVAFAVELWRGPRPSFEETHGEAVPPAWVARSDRPVG